MSSKKKENHTVTISEFKPEEMPLSCTWIVIGPPGTGKCLAKNTPVLMFDGTIKLVQHVKIGDLLMGDDSTPREVLSLAKGVENMYRVTQTDVMSPDPNSIKSSYTVNESHILSLKRGDYVYDMPIKDYMNLQEPKFYYGYRTGVDFAGQKIPVDPYLFGVWISSSINNKTDNHYALLQIRDICKKYGLSIKESHFLSFGLEMSAKYPILFLDNTWENKVIPEEYVINSRNIRLNFLAGMIDNMGTLSTDGSFVLSFPNGNENFKDMFLYLVRSLGFGCSRCQTHLLTKYNIYGKVTDIPTRIIQNRPIVDHPSISTMTRILVEHVGVDKYYGFQIDGNHRFLLGDFTVTHNTTFMENMAYYRKHIYPTARVFIGTEDGYKRFCKIFHPLYVSNYWSEEEEEKHVLRQRTCELENGRGYPGNYAINIIDDVSDDPKIYKTKLMRGLFKLGSQHWAQLAMIGSQYAIDMPPDIRKAVSYVAIGREPEEIERKKLYENFGGLAGSFAKFCDLMDQITGDYTFLIFKKRAQSNELEDCIFWFKTRQLGDWKFGCKEYREHADERYDKNYVEQITL